MDVVAELAESVPEVGALTPTQAIAGAAAIVLLASLWLASRRFGFRRHLPTIHTKDLGARLLLRYLGPDEQQHKLRLLYGLLIVTSTLVVTGFYIFSTRNLSVQADSGPAIRFLFKNVLTNFYLYAFCLLLLVGFQVSNFWKRVARLSARHTRFDKETILRLGYEGRSTDGTTRLLGDSSHSEQELRAKLLRGFAGQAHDEYPDPGRVAHDSGTAGALEGSESVAALEADYTTDADDGDERAGTPLLTRLDALEDEADELEADLDELQGELLSAGLDPERIVDADEPIALADALDSDGQVAVSEFEAKLERFEEVLEQHDLLVDVFHGAEDAGNLAASLRAAGYDPAEYDVSDEASGKTASAINDGAATDPEDSRLDGLARLRQTIQTVRMDFATAANFDELKWRFGIPAIVTFIGLVTAFQTVSFHPLFYPVLMAASVLGGGAYYTTFKWRRRRKLGSTRDAPRSRKWRSCAALVKRVEVNGVTGFYVWMGGHRYFSFDKHRLARKAGKRWHQRINREQIWPAIEEKMARNIRQMVPTVHQLEYADEVDGRPAIMDTIADTVRESENPKGVVPKQDLAERVAEQGGQFGHDPELIADCYRKMHLVGLAETDVEVTNADGESTTMTLVHLRKPGLPADLGRIQAQFSTRFDPDAEQQYPLPELTSGEPTWHTERAAPPPGHSEFDEGGYASA